MKWKKNQRTAHSYLPNMGAWQQLIFGGLSSLGQARGVVGRVRPIMTPVATSYLSGVCVK